jgi:D-alanyl-lipoteichoic acid acyltransferase DltB (MBOAT superfamily)
MELNSLAFLGTALAAVLVIPLLGGRPRATFFLALNLLFAWSHWGFEALPAGIGYVSLGYGLSRWVRGRGASAVIVSVALLAAPLVLVKRATPDPESDQLALAGVVAFAGLSFLFFKMAHVVIDAAGGAIPTLRFVRYVNYCLNFTTLLLGPIQRFQDFDAQWTGQAPPPRDDVESRVDAVNRVLRGFVKAFALAPWLSPFLLKGDLPIEVMSASELLFRSYAFYLFLYLDFSGYCDIMIGIGSLMGIRPPENFLFPFAARNVSAYWLRVHRSLTLWLTDYVFTPCYKFGLSLGAGAGPFVALAASLLVTMLVAGVWHGPTLNFVLFGLIHGVALVVMHGYDAIMGSWMGKARFRRFSQGPIVTGVATLITYNFTSLAYVFFALSARDGLRVFRRLSVVLAQAAG